MEKFDRSIKRGRSIVYMEMKGRYSVAIIACYMGDLPGSYKLWEKSCFYNPGYDFILVTDQDIASSCGNLRIVKISLGEFSRFISDRLEVQVEVDRPYKLCDFRPMFGVIFSELLERYDFWGHCDLDQIFGSLESFITQDVLAHNKKIYQLGHLTLYKNDYEMNHLYEQEGGMDWRTAVLDGHSCFFDEVVIREKCQYNNINVYTQRDYADIDPWHRRFKLSDELISIERKRYNNKKNQIFYWAKGKIYRAFIDLDGELKNDEFCYLHFQKRNLPPPKFDVEVVESFYITNQGFVERTSNLTDAMAIECYNRYPGFIIEFGEIIRFWICEYKKRLLLRIEKFV